MTLTEKEDRVRRLLADIYNVRIVDIERDDVLTFQAILRRKGLMLVDNDGVLS